MDILFWSLTLESLGLIPGVTVIKSFPNLFLIAWTSEMNAGHGGKSGRDGAIEQIAIDYAFALKISKKI